MHQGLKGMCLNGTRKLTFNQTENLDLAPLHIYKASLVDIKGPINCVVTVVHITSQEDYAIFEAFKKQNVTLVLDIIDAHKGINAVDEWGQTTLMTAVGMNHQNIVAALLNARMPRVNVNAAKFVSFICTSSISIYFHLFVKERLYRIILFNNGT